MSSFSWSLVAWLAWPPLVFLILVISWAQLHITGTCIRTSFIVAFYLKAFSWYYPFWPLLIYVEFKANSQCVGPYDLSDMHSNKQLTDWNQMTGACICSDRICTSNARKAPNAHKAHNALEAHEQKVTGPPKAVSYWPFTWQLQKHKTKPWSTFSKHVCINSSLS